MFGTRTERSARSSKADHVVFCVGGIEGAIGLRDRGAGAIWRAADVCHGGRHAVC